REGRPLCFFSRIVPGVVLGTVCCAPCRAADCPASVEAGDRGVARAVWSGSIGFGLVSIPVRLWGATTPKDVRFHQFDRGSGRRVHYRRVTGEESDSGEPLEDTPEGDWEPPTRGPEPSAGGTSTGRSEPAQGPPDKPEAVPGYEEREVPYEEVVKGYEVAEGQYVMVTPEELAALRPERSRTIEIQDFVSLDDIDPVYLD